MQPNHGALSALSWELTQLTQRVMPSVVSLHGFGSNFREDWGSGFVIDRDGSIVTNHHVVEGFDQSILGKLPHASDEVPLRLVGVDPMTDLAVLKIEGGAQHNLSPRDSPPRLGEICGAFGNPLGDYPESVSLGIVSGLSRDLTMDSSRPFVHAIQTDAAINPGNSGGPLVDAQGLVIGVNQASRNQAQGISFAIPVEIVKYVATELLRFGAVERAALGVSVAKATRVVEGSSRSCVVVTRVGTEDPRGLRQGDILLAVAGKPISDRGDLFLALSRELIGKWTEIQVVREGQLTTASVTPRKL